MFPWLYLWPVLPNTPRVDWLASDHVTRVLAAGLDETDDDEEDSDDESPPPVRS